MGKINKKYTEREYRPQKPKGRRRNFMQKEMVTDNSEGVVDRVKKMMAESRGQGIGPERLCRMGIEQQKMLDTVDEDCQVDVVLKEVEEFQCRPSSYKSGRRGKVVKRNLFGDGEKRSSVNRELRNKLIEKKKALRPGRSKNALTPDVSRGDAHSTGSDFLSSKTAPTHQTASFTEKASPLSLSAVNSSRINSSRPSTACSSSLEFCPELLAEILF